MVAATAVLLLLVASERQAGVHNAVRGVRTLPVLLSLRTECARLSAARHSSSHATKRFFASLTRCTSSSTLAGSITEETHMASVCASCARWSSCVCFSTSPILASAGPSTALSVV